MKGAIISVGDISNGLADHGDRAKASKRTHRARRLYGLVTGERVPLGHRRVFLTLALCSFALCLCIEEIFYACYRASWIN